VVCAAAMGAINSVASKIRLPRFGSF